MSTTGYPAQAFFELRAITHEMGCALMNVAGAAILLQSATFEDPKAVERLQILINEVDRLSELHNRQREILQVHRKGAVA